MTKQRVINAVISVVEQLRKELVPYDKGNLANNALRYEITNDKIDITVDLAIAPYMPYTNEPWLSERWHGKPNPNEGWWNRFAEEFAKRLNTKLRGEMK